MRKFFLLLLLFASCTREPSQETSASSSASPTEDQNLPKIVAFGNSLTAGLGLPVSESYPAVLEKMLRRNGYEYEVVNAGVSGDTTAGGLRRIDWSLEDHVKFLILELGGNDILRGQPVDLMRKNLAAMIEKAQSQNVTVLLFRIEAPSNAGPEYTREVHQAFDDLSSTYKITLVPFFLKDASSIDRLIQKDGTHPNEVGARVMAETVYKSLKPLL